VYDNTAPEGCVEAVGLMCTEYKSMQVYRTPVPPPRGRAPPGGLAGAAAASREHRFNRHHQADDGGPARLSQRLHCTHALLAGAIDREEGTDI